MKKRELVAALRRYGWYLLREGGKHEVWTNGEEQETVPRQREINERLAQKIIRNARKNPKRD